VVRETAKSGLIVLVISDYETFGLHGFIFWIPFLFCVAKRREKETAKRFSRKTVFPGCLRQAFSTFATCCGEAFARSFSESLIFHKSRVRLGFKALYSRFGGCTGRTVRWYDGGSFSADADPVVYKGD
jgi:hypothetical protein